MWAAITGSEPWSLAAICGCYLVLVYVTNRGLIAAPGYRLLLGRIRDRKAHATIIKAADDRPECVKVVEAVTARLEDLERPGTVVWRLLPRAGVIAVPLSKLAAAWSVLYHAERLLLGFESDEGVAAQAQALRLRVAEPMDTTDQQVRAALDEAQTIADLRAVLIAAHEQLDQRRLAELEREYEQHRVALWLTAVGLGAILLIGISFDVRPIMLFGALGGFLSPATAVMRSADKRDRSWGVLVLAPIGGSLAAVGGLLLVRMLSDPGLNLLGSVFQQNSWGTPPGPFAYALALLFGFSGTLFSRLAVTATKNISL
ncbi:hypothetical protein SAMN05444920_1445 [Nonomuraea solani]|uniref:Uncharacterized protein n=2 Tax=Nonomuraea solani TaxID=1144553 RepID=A0A1H6F3U3_9ACTN|nr:hypothetical protein SAMN05444920_1445 [Nonomuraea solani]